MTVGTKNSSPRCIQDLSPLLCCRCCQCLREPHLRRSLTAIGSSLNYGTQTGTPTRNKKQRKCSLKSMMHMRLCSTDISLKAGNDFRLHVCSSLPSSGHKVYFLECNFCISYISYRDIV